MGYFIPAVDTRSCYLMPLFGEGEIMSVKKFLFIGRVSSRNFAKAGAERNDKFDYNTHLNSFSTFLISQSDYFIVVVIFLLRMPTFALHLHCSQS
jgi:hypothetical protein